MKKIIIGLSFLALFISCQDKKTVPHFLDVEEQEQEKRMFFDTELELEFEKELEELGVYNYPTLFETVNNLVLIDNKEMVIRHLNKTNLAIIDSFKVQTGRGPKELEFIMAADVTDELIAVADNRLMKVILFDHEGTMVNEFMTDRRPFRLNIDSNRSLNLIYIVYDGEMDETFIYNLAESGEVNYPFEKEDYEGMNYFVTQGEIETVKDTLYYVGGYDPYIKKYVKGELIYSRATIDNHDSSLNYITMFGEDTKSTSLSPDAVLSSRDFDVKENSLFIIPYSNGDDDFSFIDVYNTDDGNYIKSYRTIDVPERINVYKDERSILTIEKVGEMGKLVFRKYKY